jgi:hypothetical protein
MLHPYNTLFIGHTGAPGCATSSPQCITGAVPQNTQPKAKVATTENLCATALARLLLHPRMCCIRVIQQSYRI